MSDKIIHLTDDSFDTDVLKADGAILVDFWAEWCGPCKMIAPFIEEVAEEYEGKAVVAKIDVDEAQEIAAEYGISSIPTVILFKDGAPIHTEVGAHDKAFYANLIEMHL